MIYLLFFVIVIAYFKIYEAPDDFRSFCRYFLPIAVLFVILVGFQYGVGADYESYYEMAQGIKPHGGAEERHEYLFLALIRLAAYLKMPQLFFVVSAVIQVIFIILTAYEMKKMNYDLYLVFFLFFALLLVFFNMFNGVRQYVAVYILIYVLIIMRDARYVESVLLILLASQFHFSVLIFLPLVFFRKYLNKLVSFRHFIVVFVILLLFSLYDFSEIYSFIISYTPYAHTYGGEAIKRMPFSGIVTKIPKLAVTIYSIYLVRDKALTAEEKYFLNLAYLACLLLVTAITANQLWRLYQYLDFFMIFPVLMMMKDEKYRKQAYLIAIVLAAILLVKIILIPRGTYLYDSVLF